MDGGFDTSENSRNISELRQLAALGVKKIVPVKLGLLILTREGKIHTYFENQCGEYVLNSGLCDRGEVFVNIAGYCEGEHYLAISSHSEIFAWGKGTEGQLGLLHSGSCAHVDIPTPIVYLSGEKVSLIACGQAARYVSQNNLPP